MDVLRTSTLMVLVALCAQCSHAQGTAECAGVYRYEEQPQTNFECNPYANNELRLVCRVEGPQLAIIRWFWKPSSTQQPQELSGPSRQPRPSDKYGVTMSTTVSQGRRSRLIVFQLNDSDAGRYFCRPELLNSTQLTPSDELILNVQSTYTVLAACSDEQLTTESTSCASIVTDDTVTEQPTTGNTGNTEFETTNSATTDANNGPTDPPSIPSPSHDTPIPTPTIILMVSEPESSSTLQVALYIVVAVIVIFCAIIVTLAITIVILYRKKGGHANFKKTADQELGANPYSGFSPDGTRSPSGDLHKEMATKSTSFQDSHKETIPSLDTTQDHTYSRLTHDTAPPPPLPANYPTNQYSKLERHSETPPPRPPKPPALRSLSNPVITTSTNAPQHLSRIYADPEDQNHPEHGSPVPLTNIYHTMDDSRQRTGDVKHHFYHVLDGKDGGQKSRGDDQADGEYSYAQSDVLPAKPPGQEHSERSRGLSTSKNLFDDPNYSPVKIPQTKDIKVIDPRYTGDYERDPTYIPPAVKVPASEVDPKYRGDYEWDPNYVPKPPPRRNSADGRPPKPPQRRQSLEVEPLLRRYMGDYERDPNYVPPPLQNGKAALDSKYRGDYERDPAYMVQLVRKTSRTGKVTSAEYSYPYPPTLTMTTEDPVPPHIPHEYTALQEALLDPPQEYAQLNPDPSETTLS